MKYPKVYRVEYRSAKATIKRLFNTYDEAADCFNTWCECMDEDKADGEVVYCVVLFLIENGNEIELARAF